MPSRLREPFGKAGLIVAIVALVAALAGGAYAADQATDSAKKRNHKAKKNKKKQKGVTVAQVRKIAKQEARKFANSNPGPAGPQGPAGANGNDGQNGSNGEPGPKGDKGDQGEPGAQGIPGQNGTFSTEPLPPGETLTGGWVLPEAGPEEDTATAVSFPIPLAEEIGLLNLKQVGVGETGPSTQCEEGTAKEPKAAPGFFCLYIGEGTIVGSGGNINILKLNALEFGTSTMGAALRVEKVEGGSPVEGLFGHARGSWAVTAPLP